MTGGKSATVKQGVILWAGGALGGVAVLPYAFDLQRDALAKSSVASLGLPTLAAIAAGQTAVLMAIAVAVGLRAARSVGLRAPVSEALATRQPVRDVVHPFVGPALGLGLLGAVLMTILDLFVFLPALPALREAGKPMIEQFVPWKAALASLYGGISEEILTRLLLLSGIAFLLRAALRRRDVPPQPAVMWTAIVVSAVLFGLGHLPATAAIVPLSGLVIARAVLLNAAIAIPCGWLFWKHGLESAMLAHWLADIVIHILVPALTVAGVLAV
ncbi:CPBP family intramembrane glutamic endopeptidase [Chondromyces crocatus]|nr:CPBP family intramembrane glutamic endopeptidase [Chondromyces crocatus]